MYDTNFDKFSVLARMATDTITEVYIGEVNEKIPSITNDVKTRYEETKSMER